jgi:hypothetical protein
LSESLDLFATVVKPLPPSVVLDHWLVPTPFPLLPNTILAAVANPDSKHRIAELWDSTIRLELALNLLTHFYAMFEYGQTISAIVQETISQRLPELSGLKGLLDQLANWPSDSCQGVVPPAGGVFPHKELQRVTRAIPFAIERDTRQLESASAIPKLTAPDGRPCWTEIGFQPGPQEIAQVRGRHPSIVVIRSPSCPELDGRLSCEVQLLRSRLIASPYETLSGLLPPVEFELHESKVDCGHSQSAKHSEDFASVNWFGEEYTLLPNKQSWSANSGRRGKMELRNSLPRFSLRKRERARRQRCEISSKTAMLGTH